MIKINFIFTILILTFIISPDYRIVAQEDNSQNQQTLSQSDDNNDNTDNNTNTPVKIKKFGKLKKNKDKEVNINVLEWSSNFFWYLLINLSTLILITLLAYFQNKKRSENIFTFLMFNLMIFMITIVLNKVKISMGAAFGLFAVFSMLRYRTEGISMKDMTYLFVFIAIGLISAIQIEYLQLIIINSVIVLFILVLDTNIFFKHESFKCIKYESIELIKPENNQLLIDDIKKRTGINIHRIEIEQISYLNDTADLKVFYYE